MYVLPVVMLLAMLCVCSSSVAQNTRGWWGKIDYKGNPWVRNDSKNVNISKGLYNRHISLWASHGRYYASDVDRWKWQRVNLFGTNEDLFTQTFVVPYLIPMLERAGANVFTPRERDWQVHETVIDNDGRMMMVDGIVSRYASKNYVEEGVWNDYRTTGFRIPESGTLRDGDTPFNQGTARFTRATKKRGDSFIIYSPEIKEAGRYAVYVSYQTMEESVDDAHYIVMHKGVDTHFRVNQRMGAGTWVYLGSFDFDAGISMDNCVIIDNQSSRKGVVTTDAVRFGGGMGNIVRGGRKSGMPRCLEGARYYAEWGGAPYYIYSTRQGKDDYSDDINVRSLMTNWLAGGSPYVPDREGGKVPIELSLALHSDAGFARDMKSIYGGLGICTTNFNDERLASGLSRFYSYDFVKDMLDQVKNDLRKTYGSWQIRDLYDKNYSESRLPGMPSAIIELLSHQSFPDMRLAHDPHFKFTMARAIYKSILRFISDGHKRKYVVTPLQPTHLSMSMDNKGRTTLSWMEQEDPLEPKAKAKSYMLYTAIGDEDFDNGKRVKGTSYSVNLQDDVVYRFRVTAVNEGGESFPSEEMAAYHHPGDEGQVMVVNGFHRLSGPAMTIGSRSGNGGYSSLGFDIDEDPGVSYGLTAGWLGRQQVFSTATAGREGPGTFGYSSEELAGKFVAGNDFNYTTEHVRAIASMRKYSVVSSSSECIGNSTRLSDYRMIDLILGNERNDGHSLGKYKTFTPAMQSALRKFTGALLVSGSYVASDNTTDDEKSFLADVLHVKLRDQNRTPASDVIGMGTSFAVWRSLNPTHYASTCSDILGVPGEMYVAVDTTSVANDSISAASAVDGDNIINENRPSSPTPMMQYVMPDNSAFTALSYADGTSAAIAYRKEGEPRRFTMGFPLDCIKQREMQGAIMRGIVNFLLE